MSSGNRDKTQFFDSNGQEAGGLWVTIENLGIKPKNQLKPNTSARHWFYRTLEEFSLPSLGFTQPPSKNLFKIYCATAICGWAVLETLIYSSKLRFLRSVRPQLTVARNYLEQVLRKPCNKLVSYDTTFFRSFIVFFLFPLMINRSFI